MNLHKPCPTCDGDRRRYLPGHASGECHGRVPMSACDGDCKGCGRWVDCATCDGTGIVVDRAKVCVVCLDFAGEIVARTHGALCATCHEVVGTFELSGLAS